MPSRGGVPVAEALLPSGRNPERLSLPALQSKMKCDPEGYESELLLIRSQFDSSLELFKQQADMNFTSISGISNDPTIARDLAEKAMFLSHVTSFFPQHLTDFPHKLAELLHRAARTLPSGLRNDLTKSLILLINRQIISIKEMLPLFMELQTLGDKALREMAFKHIVQSIKRMNLKHKDEAKNRALQNILFVMLQQEDENRARRALVTLCDLHKRQIWFDERTANAICTACFHPSSRIMISSLCFLLDYEKIENYQDSDDSSSDEDMTESPQVILRRETIYKANHQGTSASKKKKKKKLDRIVRSMKKKQRISSDRNNNIYYSPLNNLIDPQGFVEKLFARLQKCNERFEVKMMMLKVIARTVGLHQLILLNFYPYLQKYIQPHQRDVTNLLAAAVQACHDMVPPDAVEPLFKQIVNQFVHDRSRPEAITVGINAVREICLRIPLLMNEDLLQDLALYKKSHEKGVSIAARSLIALFREVCPSLLIKKDRGRPINPTARPKAYGEVNVATDVPDAELLQIIDDDVEQESLNSDDSVCSGSDNDQESLNSDDENQLGSDDEVNDHDVASDNENDGSSDYETGADDVEDEEEDDLEDSEESDDEDGEISKDGDDDLDTYSHDGSLETTTTLKDSAKKRKFSDFNDQLTAADSSLRALKKLAGTTMEDAMLEAEDGILSNEDFQRIKELKAKKEARTALAQHGLVKSTVNKIRSSDQLSLKRVDGSMLEAHVKRKLNKAERLAMVKEGREERGKYQSRAAVKQKKTGGLSNKQKEHKKIMPVVAKRKKLARARIDRRKKDRRSGKQQRGKKAWKQ
ncbi:protein SDA1 protein [Trifolium repens]|nr:protein SDA1 protein [Trifolium repens]